MVLYGPMVATLIAFIIPIAVLLTGAQTSTANPLIFAAVFSAMFSARLWGAKRLAPYQIHWPTAFALRISRVPVGVACMWWLVSRQTLDVEVTPKGGLESSGPWPLPANPVGPHRPACCSHRLRPCRTLHRVPWTPALHRPQLPG